MEETSLAKEKPSTTAPSKFSDCWTFSIETKVNEDDANRRNSNDVDKRDRFAVPLQVKEAFTQDGFAVFPEVLSRAHVDALNERLEDILRGRYDRNNRPDKTPKLLKTVYRKKTTKLNESTSAQDSVSSSEPQSTREKSVARPQGRTTRSNGKVSYAAELGFTGNLSNVKVLQVINVHKADSLFRRLAVSPVLGWIVAQLAGWTEVGTRLAQDQVWGKPAGAPPLTFHRDSPYFMFSPLDVVTVWVALDDMDDEIGPLQYVKGSHEWGDGRVGSANQFFDVQATDLLCSAASRAGVEASTLEFESMEGLLAGGISIHDGRTWHGSGPNQSRSRPRRGLGLHYVPANVRFTAEAMKSSIWKSYLGDGSIDPENIELPLEDFPITWLPDASGPFLR